MRRWFRIVAPAVFVAGVGFAYLGSGSGDGGSTSARTLPTQAPPAVVGHGSLQAPGSQPAAASPSVAIPQPNAPVAPASAEPSVPSVAPIRLTASQPQVTPQLTGNCTGPASPGEYVDVAASVAYDTAESGQLTWGVDLGAPTGEGTGPRYTDAVAGSGTLDRTEHIAIPETKSDTLAVSTWANSMPDGEPVRSGQSSLRLGATLRVMTVDETGEPVAIPVLVVTDHCYRTRGEYLHDNGAQVPVFYHLDPAVDAVITANASGYKPAQLKLPASSGKLAAGAVTEVKLVLQSRLNAAALQQNLASLAAGWYGMNAVAVTDLQTNRTISINGDRQQVAGCTIKILLMMAVAQDIDAGKYTKEDIADTVYRAMGPSQVWPAHDLFQLVGDGDVGAGVRRVNHILWGLGGTRSIITHPPGYYWEEYGYLATDGMNENYVTAEDFNKVLTKLYRGEALSPAATDYVLWSMTLAGGFLSGALGGPLPPDVKLYHKMGQVDTYNGAWDDAGIVEFQRDGRTYTYAITFLGSNSQWRNHYNYTYQASAAVWAAFDAAYSS